ncbi:Gluconate transporter [Candidatus Sulfotelmatomonas gaucii]|uniref:Gluconate transporter n=1 Tax=Candidatus Sulfuritelmatomonas gaucii TaxID=2043161 RepID=A0A2N9LMJ3_9BACT|nr:Gluconate transporter [Candidatus Sulfotelmatomonas gaucii]
MSPAAASAHDGYLLACVAGTVGLLLLFVGRLRVHAAVGLSVAALALGVAARIPLEKVPLLFTAGAGDMMGHIAIILGMGAILGQLLASSGAAAALGNALVERCGAKGMPWALLCLGLLVGVPVFFEVGLVLLLPVIVDAARRAGRSPIVVSLPVLAGLSIMHGLVPPHPGALLAATVYHAPLSAVMLWGIVAGVPAAVLAGPALEGVLYRILRWCNVSLPAEPPALGAMAAAPASKREAASDAGSSLEAPVEDAAGRIPAPGGSPRALVVILLPVVLILVGGWADSLAARGSVPNQLLHLAGYPDVAMVFAALVALVILGGRVQDRAYRVRGGLRRLTADSFVPIAGPLVILAAAGGLSGVLRASGAAQAAVTVAMGAHMPPLILAWALAAAVRVSMGSATVAIAVASGILAPLAGTMGVRPEMLVLATGSGSLILSHVNDSGFWLVGSLFKIDVKTTLSTWSVLETVLSVAGLAFTLLLAAVLK